MTPAATSVPAPGPSSRHYRAVWRWHLYAGLVTAPLAIWLALTGALYLWKPQYEAWRYRDLLQVPPLYTAPLPGTEPRPLSVAADTQFATALAAHPGARAVTFTPSPGPGRTSETVLRLPTGEAISVFVDPHLGRIVGERREADRLMTTLHDLHGELLAGRAGQLVVELAAGWLYVSLLTGLYLWWPRPRFAVWGFLLPRLGARGRTFWRDLHAVPAVWAAIGGLCLLTTGVPWTRVAGAWFKQISAALGEGTPRESNAGVHRSELTGWSPPLRAGLAATVDQLASTVPPAPAPEPAPAPLPRRMIHDDQGNMIWVEPGDPRYPVAAPRRGPPDPAAAEWCAAVLGPNARQYPISLTRVREIAAARNVPEPYAIALPIGETGVFSVLSDRNQAFNRTYLHLDQYSGDVLADVRYQDFGWMGRFVLWGIIVHEGQLFGVANQVLGTLAALGVLYMAASALLLWWQRRPVGEPAAPARALPRGLLIGGLLLAAMLPLLAASFLVAGVMDRAFAPRQPAGS